MHTFIHCHSHIYTFFPHTFIHFALVHIHSMFTFNIIHTICMSEDNVCMQEKNACMCERKYSGNGRSMVETEGRSFSCCDWLRRSSRAGSCSGLRISNQHNMMEGDESRRLQQALGVFRKILSTPETVTSLSSSLERQRTGSQAQEQHVTNNVSQS